MTWLILIGLAVWVLIIQIRLAEAERQLRAVRQARPVEPPGPVVRGRHPADPPIAAGVLAPGPGPGDARVVADEGKAVVPQEPRPPPPPGPKAPPSRRPAPAGPGVAAWLSENGLAWLGGGALALGGALLAAYAAQQGLFTPALRIWTAITLGLAMLAAGEVIRRQHLAPGGRHGLAAAMASGAGASTLYAAIWAAYALYDFLPLVLAAPLLAAVSVGLVALAVIHGEPLALLAMVGGFAVPVICNLPDWSGVALDGYLALITATGLTAMSKRGWGGAGALCLAAIGAWIIDREFHADVAGAAALLVAAPAMMLLAAGARRVPDDRGSGRALIGSLPFAALVGASGLWALWALAPPRPDPAAARAAVGAALALLAGAAARLNLARGRVLAAPAAALAFQALAFQDAAYRVGAVRIAGAPDLAPVTILAWSPLWFLASILALGGSSLMVALMPGDKRRPDGGVIGAAGVALALTILAAPMATAADGLAPLVFTGAGSLLLIGATAIARRAADPRGDLALAAWVGAGAEAFGLAIHVGLAGRPEPAAYGLLAVLLALAARRLPWRGLPEAATLAALVSLLSILGPRIAGDALAGDILWTSVALAAGAGALAQTLAWSLLRRGPAVSASAQAASTTAVISALMTLFLILRVWATPRGALLAPLGVFTESALRTVLLLAAGLTLSLRRGPGWLARARGPAFLAMGALHGAVMGGAVINPWWGWASGGAGAILPGPPLVDALALAFLVPTLLLAETARRQARSPSGSLAEWTAPITALAAFGFLTLWAILEIRRLFHGPVLTDGPTPYGEAAAQGVALLLLAWLATLVETVGPAIGGSAARGRAAAAARWAGLVVSTWLFCVVASPWWGPLEGPFSEPLLLFGLLGAGAGLTALFPGRRSIAPGAEPAFGVAARAAAALEVLVALTLAIRLAFHGPDMRAALREASVETWTYSAAWAAYGLILLAAGARSGDRTLRWLGLAALLATTAKVFLFDMATLQGVIRAASFLALGVLLLIGALAARRLGARAPAAAPASGAAEV